MRFSEKLKKLMADLNISQAQLHKLTGIGRSSISQYLSGKNEPSKDRKREIALTLGVQEDYFEQIDPSAIIQGSEVVNLPVSLAANLLGKSPGWVMKGLQDGVFPWGYAVKLTRWSYFISSVKFTEYTGIQVPVKTPSSENLEGNCPGALTHHPGRVATNIF